MIAQIATGEIEEDADQDDGKNKATQTLSRMGGQARAKKASGKHWAN